MTPPVARLRRKRFRTRRRQHNKLDPAPLEIFVGNCMSVSATPDHAMRIFVAYLMYCHRFGIDVLDLSECSDFLAQVVANHHFPGVWRVTQYGKRGSPASGSCIAVREKRAAHVAKRLVLGSEATGEGGGIRERSIVGERILVDPETPQSWATPWNNSGHAPPPRSPIARAAFMAVLVGVRGWKAGDMNLTARVVARILGMRVHGVGVICLAVPWWIPSGDVRVVPKLAGEDHHSMVVTLWPHPKEKR